LKKILGYRLKNVPFAKVVMPLGARVISAMDVNGEPTVFAVVDPGELKTEEKPVYRIETNKFYADQISDNRYIGSFAVANYGIVYHFYAEPEAPVGAIVAHVAKEAEPESPQENPRK
jgi:hypothetical protein